MTEDELYQRVGTALIEMFTEGFVQPEDESHIETIHRLSGIVEEGHVTQQLRAMGVKFGAGGWIGMSIPQLKEIQAHLNMPITRTKQSTNSFTINNHGDGNQWQVGDEASGSQTINNITFGQVLEALQTKIEKTEAPPDQKKSALATLGDLTKHPIVVELVKAGIKVAEHFQ